jgi:hypothetical protein
MRNFNPPLSRRLVSSVSCISSAPAETLSHRNFIRPIRSAASALLAILLAMPGVAMQPAFAQQACAGDAHLPASSVPAGTIAVTDSAMMYSYSNCPTSRLVKPIRLKAGQSLFFWFRVQGDQTYLSTTQSRYPFILNFYQNNGSAFVSQGLISMGGLDRAAMAAEAQGAGGVFDWRLGAEKWKLEIPGTYRIVLSQQGNEIGCGGSSMLSQCNPVIEVVP